MTRARRRRTPDPAGDPGSPADTPRADGRRARRHRRRAVIVAVPLGLVLSSAMVQGATSAAFSAATTNPGSSWSTGTVVLTDDSTAAQDVTFSGVRPGRPGAFCVLVRQGGTLPATVSLTSATAPGAVLTHPGAGGVVHLDQQLQLTVDVVTGDHADPGAVCTATFASAPAVVLTRPVTAEPVRTFAARSSYGTGAVTPTAVAAGTLLTYRIGWTLPDSPSNDDAQGDVVQVTLRWEAQGA